MISPEGWLIGVFQIEEAERGDLTEKPWCWVKTQFGPIEGHVALVELLAGLKKEFMPDLEVMDEGGYWEHRDVTQLRQKIEFLGRAIDLLAGELECDRLSPEAREDPDILATRIERLARKVQATLSRPAEHPPVHFPDDATGVAGGLGGKRSTLGCSVCRKPAQAGADAARDGRAHRCAAPTRARHSKPRWKKWCRALDWDDEMTRTMRKRPHWIAEMNEACRAAVEEPWQESLPEAVRGDADEEHPFRAHGA